MPEKMLLHCSCCGAPLPLEFTLEQCKTTGVECFFCGFKVTKPIIKKALDLGKEERPTTATTKVSVTPIKSTSSINNPVKSIPKPVNPISKSVALTPKKVAYTSNPVEINPEPPMVSKPAVVSNAPKPIEEKNSTAAPKIKKSSKKSAVSASSKKK